MTEARTGDILLMSGTALFARVISMFTESVWSHVCMVVRDDSCGIFGVLEAVRAADECKDLITGKAWTPGVRFVSATEKLTRMDCNMCVWRKLNGVQLDFESVMRVVRSCHGKPYEKNKFELMRSSFKLFGYNNKEAVDSFFCSELVAHVYTRMNVLNPKKGPSNTYTPSDFSEEVVQGLVEGVSLSKGIILLFPSKDYLSVFPLYDVTCGLFTRGCWCCWWWFRTWNTRSTERAHHTKDQGTLHKRRTTSENGETDDLENLDFSKLVYTI